MGWQGGANMAANTAAKYGGGGMDPLTLALIGGGSSLLSSIAGGIGEAQKQKQAQKDWEKQRAMRMADVEKYLKPENPRYATEKDLGTMDPAFKKMMLGRLTDFLGGEKLGKWGIDPSALLAGIGKSSAPTGPDRYQGKGILDDGQGGGQFGGASVSPTLAKQIMGKYGMGGKRTGQGV